MDSTSSPVSELKILAGKQKPNLGRYDNPPDWEEILKYFRGSELQNYFTKVLEDDIHAIIKPQYVDNIPRALAKSAIKTVVPETPDDQQQGQQQIAQETGELSEQLAQAAERMNSEPLNQPEAGEQAASAQQSAQEAQQSQQQAQQQQ